jgi:glucose/arabinose dehydrogenase
MDFFHAFTPARNLLFCHGHSSEMMKRWIGLSAGLIALAALVGCTTTPASKATARSATTPPTSSAQTATPSLPSTAPAHVTAPAAPVENPAPVPAEAAPEKPAPTPAPSLPAGEYPVLVQSDPEGATVVVNGIPVGKAPKRVILPGTTHGFFRDQVSLKVRFIAADADHSSQTVEETLTPLEKIPAAVCFTPTGATRVVR